MAVTLESQFGVDAVAVRFAAHFSRAAHQIVQDATHACTTAYMFFPMFVDKKGR